eukprot:240144-Pyramimonas_sp.AAC.1
MCCGVGRDPEGNMYKKSTIVRGDHRDSSSGRARSNKTLPLRVFRRGFVCLKRTLVHSADSGLSHLLQHALITSNPA